ncbi:TPA: hypothetical protein U2J86_004764 [Serratia marcescens]|nr:hypothetical protein [Serratia marcescens]
MSHDITLSKASRQADQLNALLVAMNLAASEIDDTDMSTLLTLALDLAGSPACWLLEEQCQREANDA